MRRVSLAVVGLLVLVLATVAAPAAGAQQRQVVVVGDSVILGAESAMVGAFSDMGWLITFDAAVNRSTSAGGEAIASHGAELTDTLVVNLGANDAGNTGAYRSRVDQIMASTAAVPHVYWLTIREVRDYYPAANQALRDAAAAYPNVTILDWHGTTAGRTDLTSSDGLHLNGAGAALMTELVTFAAVNGGAPVAAPPPPVAAAPPETAPPVPVTEAPTTAPPVTAAPTTVAPSTTVAASTTTVARRTREVAEDAEQVVDDSGTDYGNVLSWTFGGGFAVVVVLLAVVGAALGGWALVQTRGRSAPVPPPSTSSPGPPTDSPPTESPPTDSPVEAIGEPGTAALEESESSL